MRYILILSYHLLTGLIWVLLFTYSDEDFLVSYTLDACLSYVIFPNLILVLAYFDTKHGLDTQHTK